MLQRIDATSWIAVGCIVLGWFGMNLLVATFGPLQQVAHFYDLAAVMKDPRRLLTGVSESRSAGTVVFGIVCLMVSGAPLLPKIGYRKVPGLMSSAPLLLMLLCSIVLYVKASSAHIEATDGMGRLGGYIAKWANGATEWTGDVVSRHISIGAGGYLSFLASGWLAVNGNIRGRTAAQASERLVD